MKKILILLLVIFLSACPQKQEEKQEETVVSKVELLPSSFSQIVGWNEDDFAEFIPVFANNCKRILKLKSEWLGNSEIKIKTESYKQICKEFEKQNLQTNDAFKTFIENNFEPYLVTDNGNPEGKFTSYYESRINASFQKNETYKYPVYGKPEDLIEINLQDFDESLPNKKFFGMVSDQKMVPYHDRKTIETQNIGAPVLMWTDSLVDIHIMQIQGSAVAYMDNGEKVRVGYAANNGLPFKGIGRILLDNKVLPPEKINMIEIKKWLNENPEEGEKCMQMNRRYIFHKIINESGPLGAFGVPLQAGRCLAVDKSIVPLGSLLWIATNDAEKNQINKLVAAQDVGSAIKGIVRGDYFWGSGDDDVLAKAGSMNSKGIYYIFLPKGNSDEQ